MPIAPNIQIRKLRPSADKNLGHIRMVFSVAEMALEPTVPPTLGGRGTVAGHSSIPGQAHMPGSQT